LTSLRASYGQLSSEVESQRAELVAVGLENKQRASEFGVNFKSIHAAQAEALAGARKSMGEVHECLSRQGRDLRSVSDRLEDTSEYSRNSQSLLGKRLQEMLALADHRQASTLLQLTNMDKRLRILEIFCAAEPGSSRDDDSDREDEDGEDDGGSRADDGDIASVHSSNSAGDNGSVDDGSDEEGQRVQQADFETQCVARGAGSLGDAGGVRCDVSGSADFGRAVESYCSDCGGASNARGVCRWHLRVSEDVSFIGLALQCAW